MLPNQRVRQYFICLVALAVCVLYILSLVGCVSTSPGIPDIFLVKLSNNETDAQVRVGLFGTCAGFGANLTCAGTFGQNQSVKGNADEYVLPGAGTTTSNGTTRTAASSDLQSMLAVAAALQSSKGSGPGGVVAVVFVPLILGCVFFVSAVGALVTHGALVANNNGEDSSCGGEYGDKFFGADTPHSTRAWQLVGALSTYSVAATTGAAAAATAAARALLFAGTAVPGTALTSSQATSASTIVVHAGTALPLLLWFVVLLTLGWYMLMTFMWRRQ